MFQSSVYLIMRSGYSTIRLSLLLIVVLLICSTAIANDSEILELDYFFEAPSLEKVKIDGHIFDRINLPGSPNGGQIGHPSLPCYGAHILIPYGDEHQ